MIHYHGGPIGGKSEDAVRFFRGRHALVSYARADDIAIVADVCASFALDNGAFSAWKRGYDVNWDDYVKFVDQWARHPGYDFAIIPDVIGGDEEENFDLIARYADKIPNAVPVYHLHESLDHARWLANGFPRVAIGSSGMWPTPGTMSWWERISQVMEVMCDSDGRPLTKLHGLRMLDPNLYDIPFASADSANAAIHANSIQRYGIYPAPSKGQRAEVIASRIEAHNSSPIWRGHKQETLFDLEEYSCG